MTSSSGQVLVNDQPDPVGHNLSHQRVKNVHTRPYMRPEPLVVDLVALDRLVEHGLREIEHLVSRATPWNWCKLAKTPLEDHSHRSQDGDL